jgi:hypothetical protein
LQNGRKIAEGAIAVSYRLSRIVSDITDVAADLAVDLQTPYAGSSMEKQIIRWSFWLGSLCAVLALAARSLDVMGFDTLNFSTKGSEIGYHTFMNGTFFFYLFSIAISNYFCFLSNRKSETERKERRSRRLMSL